MKGIKSQRFNTQIINQPDLSLSELASFAAMRVAAGLLCCSTAEFDTF
jgi:hypothetical protein